MKIRKARMDDMQQCMDIQSPEDKRHRDIFRRNWIDEVSDKRYRILVAESEENAGKGIVGFIVWRVDEWNNMYYIEQLFVRDKGRGYGTRLIDEAKRIATENKIRILILDLQPENKDAMRFYKRNGFVKAGHIKGLFDESDRPDAVIMTLKL